MVASHNRHNIYIVTLLNFPHDLHTKFDWNVIFSFVWRNGAARHPPICRDTPFRPRGQTRDFILPMCLLLSLLFVAVRLVCWLYPSPSNQVHYNETQYHLFFQNQWPVFTWPIKKKMQMLWATQYSIRLGSTVNYFRIYYDKTHLWANCVKLLDKKLPGHCCLWWAEVLP